MNYLGLKGSLYMVKYVHEGNAYADNAVQIVRTSGKLKKYMGQNYKYYHNHTISGRTLERKDGCCLTRTVLERTP